jgi:hypothetical protein
MSAVLIAEEGIDMPRGMALRTALISLVTITVTTSLVAGLCAAEIERTPYDTAVGWGIALGLAVSGYLLMAGCWLLQFRRARRACDGVAESWQVLPLLGAFRQLRAPYLLLLAPSARLPTPPAFTYNPGHCELQRFLWDPAINRLRPGDPVLVRRYGRFAVVDLPDGTRLWPSGALRVSDPKNWTLTERPSGVRTRFRELRERTMGGDKGAAGELIRIIRKKAYIPATEKVDPLDPAFEVPPEPTTTWPKAGYALTLAVVAGAGLSGEFGPVTAIAAAVYAAGFAVHIWGWYGSDPERVD